MPPQKTKELTDDEKFQAQILQEHEVHRLHRQYTLLDRDRNLFFGGGQILRQNKVLSIYGKEHHNIATDLAVANAPAKRREDSKIADFLTALLEEYEHLTGEVKKKKVWIAEIMGQIKDVQKTVHSLQAKQITDRQYEDRVWKAFKTLEALENKLEVQMGKFGSICTHNIRLREEIHYLLAERAAFMKIWNKMLDKLTLGKKYMLDLIEQATIAYDQREEWLSKLQALRLKTHQEYLCFTQQMRDYNQKLDNSKKLEAFFSLKTRKRKMNDLEMKDMLKRREFQDNLRKLIADYKKMMSEIYEFTAESQVGVIAKKYYLAEQENFSKFTYINLLQQEMETLGDQLAQIHLEIDTSRDLYEKRNIQQLTRLSDLENELDTMKEDEKGLENELKEADAKLQFIMDGIMQLFKIARCSADPLICLLADQTVIKPYNAVLYLELVENRIHELVLSSCYKDRKAVAAAKDEKRPRLSIQTLDKFTESNPCPLCVEHEMVWDAIDTVQHVMTREEAQKALLEKLNDPDGASRIHNVSKCHLPKSREIMQKRYQL